MAATKKRSTASQSAGRTASAKKTTTAAAKRSAALKQDAGASSPAKRNSAKGNSAKGNTSKGKTTTSHDAIKRWAEKRGGHPAAVKRTARGSDAGILRIDFPGYRGQDTLKEISWDEFFEKFDEKNLAFLYQEKTATGKPSRFFKLVSRENARAKSRAK